VKGLEGPVAGRAAWTCYAVYQHEYQADQARAALVRAGYAADVEPTDNKHFAVWFDHPRELNP
jgi:hypothetical protein